MGMWFMTHLGKNWTQYKPHGEENGKSQDSAVVGSFTV
jgi:hypothetical protein